jgi:putative ATP-grasp target RiPP
MTSAVAPSRFAANAFAGDSAQFPLSRGTFTSASDEIPSPEGVRPWGLCRMTEVLVEGVPSPAGHYDHEQQVRVDGEGRPLIEMGPPTAPTTGQQDGDEGPSEEYLND